jgi:hypothetical protein
MVLRAADQAHYGTKQDGRARVAIAESAQAY